MTDLTNQRFGKLTVIKKGRSQTKQGRFYWICKCDCGKRKSVITGSLVYGLTRSCGCLHKGKGRPTKFTQEEFFNHIKRIIKHRMD